MAGTAPAPATFVDASSLQQAQMAAFINSLPPDQRGAAQAQLALMARQAANRKYLKKAIRKFSSALTNGASTQTYAVGQPFTFNLPTANDAFCEGIMVRLALSYTLAAGTGATYAANACGGLGFIDTIEVRYNRSQIKMRPQMLRHLAMLNALDDTSLPSSVIAGQQNSTIQSYVSSTLATAAGAQTYNVEFYLPFNLLRGDDPRGILPMMGGETGIQVIVNTPQALLGNDPVLNVYSASGGTGNAVTGVGGTIQIEAVYRDGDDYNSPNKLPFDLSAVQGTMQMQIDQQLTNLTGGNILRGKLNIMGLHAYVILLVVDGQQSNKYSAMTNFQYLESAKDSVGANVFWKFGQTTNQDVREWFYRFRRRTGAIEQDLDEGVVPMVAAPVVGIADAAQRDGEQYLNNTTSGWPDWHYGLQLGTVSSPLSGVNPRVEPHVFYVNPTGLIPV